MDPSGRVLFVAFEPWETRLGFELLNQMAGNRNPESLALLVADPYQVRNRRSSRRVERERRIATFRYAVAFENLDSWQAQLASSRDEEALRENLARLEKRTGISAIADLADSDIILNPMERAPYYFPMTQAQKLSLMSLVLSRVADFLEDFAPQSVWMIGDNYLVKNFVGSYAHAKNLEIRVVRHARIGNYLKVDSFFYPPLPLTDSRAVSPPKSRKSSTLLKDNVPLYFGSAVGADKVLLRDCRTNPIKSAWKFVILAASEQGRQLKRRPSSRVTALRRARVYTSSSWRVHVYLAARKLRMIRYSLDREFFSSSPLPSDYVLFPLHLRPESSVLSHNLGLREEEVIDEISRILKRLDSKLTLLVLENPSMVADRRRSFYRRLRQLPHVVLVDPSKDTRALIASAKGVITLAGSAAIEASLLDIPVHVVGAPDFVGAIRSFGIDALEPFLVGCESGDAPSSRESVAEYLRGILGENQQGQLGWPAVSSSTSLRETVVTLANLFNDGARSKGGPICSSRG